MKQFTVHRAPRVLTVHLKRFDYHRLMGGKVGRHIDFPTRLNLRPFMSVRQVGSRLSYLSSPIHCVSSLTLSLTLPEFVVGACQLHPVRRAGAFRLQLQLRPLLLLRQGPQPNLVLHE